MDSADPVVNSAVPLLDTLRQPDGPADDRTLDPGSRVWPSGLLQVRLHQRLCRLGPPLLLSQPLFLLEVLAQKTPQEQRTPRQRHGLRAPNTRRVEGETWRRHSLGTGRRLSPLVNLHPPHPADRRLPGLSPHGRHGTAAPRIAGQVVQTVLRFTLQPGRPNLRQEQLLVHCHV